MSWLLLQFCAASLFSLGFLAAAGNTFRNGNQISSRTLKRIWIATMIVFAIWAVRQVSFYFGRDINPFIPFYFRSITNYALPIGANLLFLATVHFISNPLRNRWPLALFGPLLTIAAFIIDPALWGDLFMAVQLSQIAVSQFMIWLLLFISAWLFPMLASWVFADQQMRNTPVSFYRQQIIYWMGLITLFAIGGAFAIAQGKESLPAQQIAAILLLTAGWLGTLAVTRQYLPTLQAGLRVLGAYAGRGLAYFAVAALTLTLVVLTANFDEESATSFIVPGAALLTAGLIGINFLFNAFAGRMSSDQPSESDTVRYDPLNIRYSELRPMPALAAELVNVLIDAAGANRGWLMLHEEGPSGGMIFRPLDDNGEPAPVSLPSSSPFIHYLQSQDRPLTRSDFKQLPDFDQMPVYEADLHQKWDVDIYVPLKRGGQLLALAGLSGSNRREGFSQEDLNQVTQIAPRLGLAFSQVRRNHLLQETLDSVHERTDRMRQEWRRLSQLVDFYKQFTGLLSPDHLRRPFTNLSLTVQQLESQTASLNGQFDQTMSQLRDEVNEAQALIENLIAVASHLEKQDAFDFQTVYMDEVLRKIVVDLEEMADARRVAVDLYVRGRILPVMGDSERLEEAILQLAHNALKFNRIGGKVQLTCQMLRDEVRIEVIDKGVGIPREQIPHLWHGLTRPFGRETLGTRRRTRIGLPLVRFIIKSHGGRVEVESAHGRGSTFRVILPARIADDEEER